MSITPEEFEKLKTRVHAEADKVQAVMLEQAKNTGRIDSCEQSIERLRQSSATSEQVISASTILGLKLDHLLGNQHDMRQQLTRSSRVVYLMVIAGVVALSWAVLR